MQKIFQSPILCLTTVFDSSRSSVAKALRINFARSVVSERGIFLIEMFSGPDYISPSRILMSLLLRFKVLGHVNIGARVCKDVFSSFLLFASRNLRMLIDEDYTGC